MLIKKKKQQTNSLPSCKPASTNMIYEIVQSIKKFFCDELRMQLKTIWVKSKNTPITV